jgi:hypothetical protein
MTGFLKSIYERPYRTIFAAAAAMSAHGLYTAAVELGHIPWFLAWSYVLIVDLLAVSAYRTWRQAVESGQQHWAWIVAASAAAGTITLNTFAAYPELAAWWVGPAIAGFVPIAALVAVALRMAEERLQVTAEGGGGINEPEPILIPVEDPATDPDPVTEPVIEPEPPVTPDRPAAAVATVTVTRPRLAAIPADTDRTDQAVAAIVAAYVASGGHVTDAELTALVADRLGCSDRTARRRLQPFRTGEVAA